MPHDAASVVSCSCGVTYERRLVDLPIKDVGEFACEKCGAVLERWRGKLVPTFKRAETPGANR